MLVDLQDASANRAYFSLTQAVIPRPIAWVLSENEGGDYNLAPFSYFNAVSSDPPLLLISVGTRPDGAHKDTRVNIEQRGEFVVHIAHREMLEALNATSAGLPPGISEVEREGLETAPFPLSRLPRLAACRIAIACERHRIIEIGDAPQSLILGRVRGLWLDDAVADLDAEGRLRIDAERVDPIGRLGAGEYVGFGEIRRLSRPE